MGSNENYMEVKGNNRMMGVKKSNRKQREVTRLKGEVKVSKGEKREVKGASISKGK